MKRTIKNYRRKLSLGSAILKYLGVDPDI